MSFLPTPGQHSRRAAFYHQLGQLLAASIPLLGALELQQRNAPDAAWRAALGRARLLVESGGTFTESLRAQPGVFPEFDLALLEAGESSGRLPSCFEALSAHYEQAARLLRELLSGLVYPALLFHLAVLIGPLPALFQSGNVLIYLLSVLAGLVPLYGLAIGGAVILSRSGSAPLELALHRVPWLGAARRNLALARLASALEALLSAGMPILQAWPVAARASGSVVLRSVVESWRERCEAGVTPAEALRESREFPDVFAGMYETGERTGTLDESCRRLAVWHREEGSRQLKALAEWVPKLVYLLVAGFVAWQVIRFWTGYFSGIQKAVDF